jgi:hypothetical protein
MMQNEPITGMGKGGKCEMAIYYSKISQHNNIKLGYSLHYMNNPIIKLLSTT